MEPGQVKQFKISKKGFRSLRLNYLLWAICVWIPGSLFQLAIHWTVTIDGVVQLDKAGVRFVVEFIAFFFLLTIALGQRRVKTMFSGYTIRVSDAAIEKSNNGFNPSVLLLKDVVKVTRSYRGSLKIEGNGARPILIPYQIENRQELEEILKNMVPVFLGGPYNFYRKYYLVVAYLAVVLISIDIHLHDKITIIVNSILLAAVIIADAIYRWKKRHLTAPKFTWIYFSVLAITFAGVIAALIVKLMK